jgi:hypothetical protein
VVESRTKKPVLAELADACSKFVGPFYAQRIRGVEWESAVRLVLEEERLYGFEIAVECFPELWDRETQ